MPSTFSPCLTTPIAAAARLRLTAQQPLIERAPFTTLLIPLPLSLRVLRMAPTSHLFNGVVGPDASMSMAQAVSTRVLSRFFLCTTWLLGFVSSIFNTQLSFNSPALQRFSTANYLLGVGTRVSETPTAGALPPPLALRNRGCNRANS